jgi:hypothetical protein
MQARQQRGVIEASASQEAARWAALKEIRLFEQPLGVGLAAEDAPDPPGIEEHLQAAILRDAHDLAHGLVVVGGVALGESVHDPIEAARAQLRHVPAHVARDAIAVVAGGKFHADP